MMKRNKVAVVTGGASGIGLAFAKTLSSECNLALIGRNRDKLEQVKQTFVQDGRQCKTYVCDVQMEDQMTIAAEQIFQDYGTIDFLIVNAGTVHVGTLASASFSSLKQDLMVNLWGAMVTTKCFLKYLAGHARIIFISSGFGLAAAAGYSSYSAAKTGMIAFAESVQRELLYRGVSVHVVIPPDVRTDMYQSELEQMPPWMRAKRSQIQTISPLELAEKTLIKIKKKNPFLIVLGGELKALALANRLLPRNIRDSLVNHILPRPRSDAESEQISISEPTFC